MVVTGGTVSFSFSDALTKIVNTKLRTIKNRLFFIFYRFKFVRAKVGEHSQASKQLGLSIFYRSIKQALRACGFS
jgi:hypothetical protein